MQISPTCSTINTNFKAVNIVQIPKKAFSNPENLENCKKEFSKALDCATMNRTNGILGTIKNLFNNIKPSNTKSYLEKPTYYYAKNAMQKNNINYSLSWLSQHTGVPIAENLENGMHSFYVVTKDNMIDFLNAYTPPIKNVSELLKEALKKHPLDSKLADVCARVKIANLIERNFDRLIEYKGIPIIKIETLDDLPKIVKDLDV